MWVSRSQGIKSSAAFCFSPTVPLLWFRRGLRVHGHFAFLALVSVSALVASLAVWIPQGADRLQGEMQMAADHGQQRSIAPMLAPKASSALVPVALSLTFCVFSAVSSWVLGLGKDGPPIDTLTPLPGSR